MFRHLGRLIWNRKRENALLLVELVAAFLVVFFIAAGASHTAWLYRQPIGFEWQDSWEVHLSTGGGTEWRAADGQRLIDVLAAVRGHPDVAWAHTIKMSPFRNWRWTSTVSSGDVEVNAMVNTLSDGGPQDLGVNLRTGRWFGPEDAGREDEPVLINARLAGELFGDADPIGKDIRKPDEGEEDTHIPWRVIGTFEDFRQLGELSPLGGYVLGRHALERLEERAGALVVRAAPGLGAAFEQQLLELLRRVAPEWKFTTTKLARLRADQIRAKVLPLLVGGAVSVFLLLMVAFGLFGVLWQNVTRRTGELGLRRAVGATRHHIGRQIILEMGLLAGLAVAIGALVGLQFPLLGTFPTLNWRSALEATAAAGGLIVALCAICALYPAALAARRAPVDALHHE